MKKKVQSPEQINYVFNSNLFSSCATLSVQQIPKDFNILEISPDRGGSNKFEEVTFSYFGDENKRVLGVKDMG